MVADTVADRPLRFLEARSRIDAFAASVDVVRAIANIGALAWEAHYRAVTSYARGNKRDRAGGKRPQINRRDFMNGVGVTVGGTLLLPCVSGFFPSFAVAQPPRYYPPTLTGMRGSHDGAYEVAHALRDGVVFDSPDDRDDVYDLIVVGAGISGLSAAYFFRQQVDTDARILVLDNHDDFGGHAKRNEFWQGGRMHLRNGGTLNVEAPSQYSEIASALLREIGIDRTRYYRAIAPVKDRYQELGMGGDGVFFDRKLYHGDKIVPGFGKRPFPEFFAEAPMSEKARADAIRLHTEQRDYFPGLSPAGKREKLIRMSYYDYVVQVVGCEPEVAALYNPYTLSLFATGVDAIPAMYGREMGFPGFDGMSLPETPPDLLANEPGGQHGRENPRRADSGDPDMYFPDGNATIARLLVGSLIPGSIRASTMEDVVLARADYERLDEASSRVRIRLNSTAIRVEQTGTGVAVTYVQNGRPARVRSNAAVLACWHSVIPWICPDLPDRQKQALGDGEKSPVVYTSVLLSKWRPLVDAKVSYVGAPGSYHTSVSLSTPLTLGKYATGENPDQPIVLGMARFPCKPGLSRREQHRAGRAELLTTTFENFETEIRAQLDTMFGPYGLDAESDILAITVNRWPHGYTYSYNPLFDPVEWAYTTTDERPNVIARQPHGRIAIANADAAASPHTDAAINEAWRAVSELAAVV